MSDFYKNFLLAQGEFSTLPKDKTGYGYKYTDFDTVVTTVRPILAKHGIGFFQALTENGLKTALYDGEGVQIESLAILPDVQMAKTNSAQNLGAAITYMKRYALCAILGISSDEDVDGNAQMKNAQQQNPQMKNAQQQNPQPKPAQSKMTDAQKEALKTMFASGVFTEEEKAMYRKECRTFLAQGGNPEAFVKRVKGVYNQRAVC